MSNLTLHKNDEPRPEMDELLNDYFQSAMPKPWPMFKAPKPMRVREPQSAWSRYTGRIALAACVMLLIAGYWSLSGSFPQADAPNGMQRVTDPSAVGFPKTKKAESPNDQLVPVNPNRKTK